MANGTILKIKAREPSNERGIEKEMAAIRQQLVEQGFAIPDGRVEEALRKAREMGVGIAVSISNALGQENATFTKKAVWTFTGRKIKIVLETKKGPPVKSVRGK